jgi:hypothetical protein
MTARTATLQRGATGAEAGGAAAVAAGFDAEVRLLYRDICERHGLVRLTDKALAAKVSNILADQDSTAADLRLAVEVLGMLPVPVAEPGVTGL